MTMRTAVSGLLGLAGLLLAPLVGLGQPPDEKTVADVVIRNNRLVSTDRVLAQLETRRDRPYKPATIQADITRLMTTKSFANVEVKFEMTQDDKVIVYFDVAELSNMVAEIRFEGAKHVKDDELLSATGLHRGMVLNPIANKLAANSIVRKYQDMGRLFAHVDLVEGGNPGDRRVVFRITEGPVVKVSAVDFVGHNFVAGERLRQQINTSRSFLNQVGGDYNPAMTEFDVSRLEDYYRTFGFQDVRIHPEKIPSPDNRTVKIVFHIDEGPRYHVKQVQLVGNKHFPEERVVGVTKLRSGNTYDRNIIQADLKNITDLYGNTGRKVVAREQVFYTGPGEVNVQYELQERPPATVGDVKIIGNEVTKDRVIRRQIPLYPGQILTYPDMAVAERNLARLQIFETDPEKGQRPTLSILDPDSDNPVKDILVQVQETQTGSFLLGVGVNSDAGLTGSIVLNEKNFDITRPPLSIDEMLSGRAFRGAGQEFRLEAVPGTRFQRYTASFREPYLLDSQFSLGVSGYYYTRGYAEYNEQRVGTRVTLGRRLNPLWSANATVRVEGIDIFDVPAFFPPEITQDVGDSFLVGLRGALVRDSRDSYLRPTEGSQLEFGYEQILGDFTYPLFTAEGSKYFTVYQRPDGSGRQVLAARSQVSFAGDDAPVYERFYAGGFRSMRGFEFRGVGPFVQGLNVGGDFLWLNSLEYQIPLVASDQLYAVAFLDSGTVEADIELQNYRVSAGFGFRIQVPMLGPVPIALDFGFPIVKGPQDREQLFSFWLGFFN